MTTRELSVDLPGLLRVFGGHLYSSPGVFVRELVQNAVDAIVERRRSEPGFTGAVRVDSAGKRFEIHDDGIGLDAAGIELALQKIGYSTKTSDDDLLGRFGIGLLSAFLVADEIEVETKTKRGHALVWRAKPDGTTSLTDGTRTTQGTSVRLSINDAHASYAEPAMIRELLERYAQWLPFDIVHGDQRVTKPAPWRGDMEAWLESRGITPLAILPIESPIAHGALWIVERGIANAGRIDVLLRGMLLETGARQLLPAWATFVSGIIEAPKLAPTASREAYVEDDAAAALAGELSRSLLDGLHRMAREDPATFDRVLAAHYLALRGACVDTPELIDAIGDRMPFQTNVGLVDLRTLCELQPDRAVYYVETPQDFAHTAPLANAQDIPLIDASYLHDVPFLRAWAERRGATIVHLGERKLELLIQPAPELAERFAGVLAIAADALSHFDMEPELGRFEPSAMPAFVIADAAMTGRRAATIVKRSSAALARSLLANLEVAQRSTRFVLNANNRLVAALPALAAADRERAAGLIRILYLQSAMTLHRTLSVAEIRALSDDLLTLVERDLIAPPTELN